MPGHAEFTQNPPACRAVQSDNIVTNGKNSSRVCNVHLPKYVEVVVLIIIEVNYVIV